MHHFEYVFGATAAPRFWYLPTHRRPEASALALLRRFPGVVSIVFKYLCSALFEQPSHLTTAIAGPRPTKNVFAWFATGMTKDKGSQPSAKDQQK